jgi:hypothetical protein
MLAIRYVTLAALVIWLGGLATVTLITGTSGADLQRFQTAGTACGVTMLVGLVVLKFVGPPPPAFFPRVGLVALILAIAVSTRLWALGPFAVLAQMALGFVLLFWYVRE